jgi:V/A-type H+-transporting ATPase subunit E
MAAVENIIKRIQTDASDRASHYINEAHKEAAEIKKSIEAELEKEKNAIQLENEKTMKMLRGRALSEAKLETRKLKLNAKEEVIIKTFEEAVTKFQALHHNEVEQYLRRAITKVSDLLPGNLIVQCRDKDKEIISRIAGQTGGRVAVSPESIDCLGGVVIHSADKTTRIDATFDGLLKRLKNDLRKEVAEILFADEA